MLKNLLKFLILLAFTYAVARLVVVYKDSRLNIPCAPYIQMLTTDSVIIHWLTEGDTSGIVRYGEDRENLTMTMSDLSVTNDHVVRLADLKPATRYYYQVGDSSGSDAEKYWFKTYPEDVVATRIWVIGDSGEAGKTLDQVRDSAFGWMRANALPSPIADNTQQQEQQDEPEALFDLWLALGDIAYRSGTYEQYHAALFDTFGDVLPHTAILPVYGNHDDRRWTYFKIFDLPQDAEAGGLASGTENYYAVDYSNIHVVILDSQSSDRSSDGAMATWLKQDLAQNTKPWVIVAFHHPPYSKGTHDSDDESDSGGRMLDMRENILPILEQSGVDLVLSGHSHMYERSYMIDCAYEKAETFSSQNNIVTSGINNKHQSYRKSLDEKSHQGTVYMVAGSSSKVDHGPLDHPVHHVGLEEAGSVVIDVVDNKLTSRFINNKGQVIDEFSIQKDVSYAGTYKGCKAKN